MIERFKDPKFWAMLLTPVIAALAMYLNGGMDLSHALGSALSGLIAGLLGVTQPQLAMQAPEVPKAPTE